MKKITTAVAKNTPTLTVAPRIPDATVDKHKTDSLGNTSSKNIT